MIPSFSEIAAIWADAISHPRTVPGKIALALAVTGAAAVAWKIASAEAPDASIARLTGRTPVRR
jgi:hypothetical protein